MIGCLTSLITGMFLMEFGDHPGEFIPVQDAAGKNTGIGIDERGEIE